MEGGARGVVVALLAFAVTFSAGFAMREVPEWDPASTWPLAALPAYRADLDRAGGVVQRRSRGRWEDVRAGSVLYDHDVLRVGNASFAWARLAGGGTLQLAAESVTRVEGSNAVRLESGGLRVAEGGQPLQVSLGNGDDLIKIAKGPVSVRWLEDGSVEVHNESDAVVEVAFGAERGVVPPGKMTTGGANGLEPARDPPRMAEAVRFERLPKLARGDTLLVEGRLDPALRIASASVGGLEAEISPDGSFRVAVPLAVGMNRISLVTRDVFGNEQVYDIAPVRRLSEAEVAALRFEWSRAEEVTTTWGE